MNIHVGVDVGAVGVKAAVLLSSDLAAALLRGETALQLRSLAASDSRGLAILLTGYRRTRGRPLEAVRLLLGDLQKIVGAARIAGITLTGSGSGVAAEALDAPRCNEFQAITRAIDLLHPQVRTVFEMGGETSKFLRLEPDPKSGRLGIVDYSTNGDCAAGTGSFLDQQASRLKYKVEEIGGIAGGASRSAQIAGRCSVFAKSDMIHAQQKGFTPPEVLRGLCNAVARNFRTAVVRGKALVPPVALIGGVSANLAVVKGLLEAFELDDGQMFVPPGAESLAAVGAALIGSETASSSRPPVTAGLVDLARVADGDGRAFPSSPRLSMERVKLLRDRVKPYDFGRNGRVIDAYMGLDIGSVGTKLVLIDEQGDVIHSIFTRTDGRPIEVVSRCLKELRESVGLRVRICAVGSTGSGRELIGELVGADSINDEITCHKTGATFVGDRLLGKRPDTIFEIGGQDSKYISLEPEGRAMARSPSEPRGPLEQSRAREEAVFSEQSRDRKGAVTPRFGSPTDCRGDRSLAVAAPLSHGSPGRGERPRGCPEPEGGETADTVVVDFTMNDACAAGTGSFLEERAEELGVSIKGEFSRLALSSEAPIRLGERCTVFMERDVNSYMQRGARREDVIAGLAYSIVYNYINRVVRGRPIGDCIFFQGGTAYNDAVAAAFSLVCGKEIIVPPHNAVLGAIGAALLAKEKMAASRDQTRFRGWEMEAVDYTLREFTCKGCGNQCSVQEFNVEGEKTFWGDKCSDRFRKRAKTDLKPVIPDLVSLRHELLHSDDQGDPPDAKVRIGIPMAMYTHDWLPLVRRFFRQCGFGVVVSGETNHRTVQMGLDSVVAEPCFPLIVAHGHVADLVGREVDYIWLPNILSAETRFMENESHVCPWGQTLPFVIRQARPFRSWQGRILCPTIRAREGTAHVREVLVGVAQDLGVKRVAAEAAFDAGLAVHQRFRAEYARAGREALDLLDRTGEPAIVLVGRPYNVHDPGVSLSVARKLRDYYGVNIVPVDALPVADIDVRDVNDNMYWEYGRKILAAGKIVASRANLHIIYITNFKCGPDSFIKAFIRPASGKPFLTLQFDGHSNDAGMMTRCEAYLDSKGILRWWRQDKNEPADRLLQVERSTSPKCPTSAPG